MAARPTPRGRGRKLWCIGGSGTVDPHGVIQAGAALWEAPELGPSLFGNKAPCLGHSYELHGAAFAPAPGLVGSRKEEQKRGDQFGASWTSRDHQPRNFAKPGA